MKRTSLNFKTGLIAALVAALLGVILLLIGGLRYGVPTGPIMYAGYALLLAAVIIKRVTWRCPSCGVPFRMNSIRLPLRCPSCGTDFGDIVRPAARKKSQ